MRVITAVGLGYAVGYGLGDYVEQRQRVVGEIEHIVVTGLIIPTVTLLAWRALRARVSA
ncbi:MAG: hypothetical protein ACE5HK_03505 [Candidatus Methylomirabilales bacterium]